MTVRIELPDDRVRLLEEQAAARGVSVEEYVLDVVEKELDRSEALPEPHDEWERQFLEWVRSFPPDLPVLSDYAISRESIYE